MWAVELSPRFDRDFEALPNQVQQAIDGKLDQLAADPFTAGLRKLSGRPVRWRVRVGDYRILTELDTRARTVTVLRVLHRREAYR